jgi:23S rRNA pseudouridine1911/1915/1917 synthase
MAEPLETESFEVEPADAGERIDAYLARVAPLHSRSRLKALIKVGRVHLNGTRLDDPNHRVVAGDLIELAFPEPEPAEPQAEAIELAVVYEDKHLLVIDKPAGLVVHPGAGNPDGTLVNALLHHCGDSLSGIGGVKRPGIVHRLDKDTSGLLVVAKSDVAHRGLSEQFADHGREGPLVREYIALVWGVPKPSKGRIEAALDRDRHNRQKQAVKRGGGRHAVTHYTVTEVLAGGLASLVSCRLETGRTHQIRVHLAHIGHPLVGDRVYGSGFSSKAGILRDAAAVALGGFRRQALHAGILGFRHPVNGKEMIFKAALPPDMAFLVEQFREGGV